MRRLALVLVILFLAVTAFAQSKRAPRVTPIPNGTQVHARIIENLSSETAKEGDVFHATLTEPVEADGRVIYKRGADVVGRVVTAESSGRLSKPGVLSLALTKIGDQSVVTENYVIKGESHTKSNVTKIGGGAALGAIIGGIAGGGKGAAIGAGVGAAAGTGVAAGTGKKPATVESEAILSWTVTSSSTSTAAASEPATTSNNNTVQPAGMKDYSEEDRVASTTAFDSADRKAIRSCFRENASSLPPGLAKRQSLPPGLEKQLQRNGTLPPGLQKKVQPLPDVCESRLPKLPSGYERAIYGGRVFLLDWDYKILDIFSVENAH